MENKFSTDPVRGLFDDQGRMLACLTNFRYTVYMEGARIGMGGIAGVASPPEYRRGGHVAEMLRACIRETRDQGMPLSSLFPFKQPFYRRYGWEAACAWLTIAVERLAAPNRKAMQLLSEALRGDAMFFYEYFWLRASSLSSGANHPAGGIRRGVAE